jgi:hypothetical protein
LYLPTRAAMAIAVLEDHRERRLDVPSMVAPRWHRRRDVSFDVAEWSRVDGEVRSIQHLDASIVLAVERGHGGRAAGFRSVRRAVEPKPKMIHLDWVSRRI